MKHLIVLTFLLAAAPAWALEPPPAPAHPVPAASEDFLYYHPDLGARHDGMVAYSRHDFEYALRAFTRAARFADKPSQAMLASMYWDGVGTAQDKATAYAWADLAAERGYPWLLATRERYWQSMTKDEQQRAVAIGQSLYAEYGDAAAQPRLEVWLSRGRKQTTGSHTGFVGTLEIEKSDGFGVSTTGSDGNDYYADKYWRPAQYWGAQAKAWNPNSHGTVSVGALQEVGTNLQPASEASPASPEEPKH
ncbi:MAG: sel1 repeat family protein [Proteobacteria bacterium]|nr:sel1 repeat family protein [Pseudomonadota bacterium]